MAMITLWTIHHHLYTLLSVCPSVCLSAVNLNSYDRGFFDTRETLRRTKAFEKVFEMELKVLDYDDCTMVQCFY